MSPADASDLVILVDASDRALGTAPKLAVHRDGRLHRAISVQIRDQAGLLLLQKRSSDKYHSGGLWTNTCCSHPRPGETALAAAQRRLGEEMGIVCPLRPLFETTYRAALDNGMVEHEVVHVFGGLYDGVVHPDPAEVEDVAWIPIADVGDAVARQPERYSAWFGIYVRDHWRALTEHAGGDQR